MPGERVFSVDADTIARDIGNLKSVNLIMLGAMLSRLSATQNLFCTLADIQAVLNAQISGSPAKLEKFSAAIDAGFRA